MEWCELSQNMEAEAEEKGNMKDMRNRDKASA